MNTTEQTPNAPNYLKTLAKDFSAGIVVFLVALPLCLGVAMASGAPLMSGLIAGIVGGILITWISGSQTSVSGPAAGLTAIVATQISTLGSFEAFLPAILIAGVLQIFIGIMKAGSLAAFFPSSVIKGLLAAIGIILILKQIPHLIGYDVDWLGDMGFLQQDKENTFTEIAISFLNIHPGTTLIGAVSMFLLIFWDKLKLNKLSIPAPLMIVGGGILGVLALRQVGGYWNIDSSHLVQIPTINSLNSLKGAIATPNFSVLTSSPVWIAAITVAIVATLETLLNLEAVDKIDKQKRISPPNRELIAQGVGNMTCGLIGGLPVTSVVVRSSVGIDAGGKTKITSFVHGILLLVMILLAPGLLNLIPFSCLAAVLMVTGFKLAKPALFKQMWQEGKNQFIPFVITVVAIVFTDLLMGIFIGLTTSIGFILFSNLKRPPFLIHEKHLDEDVIRIKLGSQISFLNRASLLKTIHSFPRGSHVVLDARRTDYIDPDILDLFREFEEEIAPAHDIKLSMMGFEEKYEFKERIAYVEVPTKEVQERLSPDDVLGLLKEGNTRIVEGEPILRDFRRQVRVNSQGQNPLAVVLSCMDSRAATEKIFDMGLGDLFSVRVAGNIVSSKILGSMEYGCAVAGAKLVVVMGHSKCGAVSSAVKLNAENTNALKFTGCDNLDTIIKPIAEIVEGETSQGATPDSSNEAFVDHISKLNVLKTMEKIRSNSDKLNSLIESGQIKLVGGFYDVSTGKVSFFEALSDNGE
jgi:carbonic anhydrase/SulP family sulfate permease